MTRIALLLCGSVITLTLIIVGCNTHYSSVGSPAVSSDAGVFEARAAKAVADGGGVAPDAPEPVDGEFDRNLQAGTLTAGSFDDLAHPDAFPKWLRDLRQNNDHKAIERMAKPAVILAVTDAAGAPVVGARVVVVDASGKRSPKLTTRTDGRVSVIADDGLNTEAALHAEITAPGRPTQKVAAGVSGEGELRVVIDAAPAGRVQRLDIAIVIDCTGSMSDELEYLKVEIDAIARSVSERYPGIQQRYALVAYRDEGDDYVTRVFRFNPLDAFSKSLGRQVAAGGGDYPEAMHKALSDANQLAWSDGPAARIAFLVADAPPHDDKIDAALASASTLRGKGVAVYPVAASGVADMAEFVMRSAAIMTGGEYLFLTDDSGVGNPHAEPHLPHYTVTALRDQMIRSIASQIEGRRVDHDPARIIRRVDNRQKQEDKAPVDPEPQPADEG